VIPITGEKWAALSEAYATLIAEHLGPGSRWLDAGTGSRILEEDLEVLENWLTQQSGMTVGMDLQVTQHLNIRTSKSGAERSNPELCWRGSQTVGGALQMKVFSHVANRRNRRTIVVVFGIKKEIPA
jgi:hypothetical protein